MRIQPVDATDRWNRSAGVSKFSVFRGRSLSRLAGLYGRHPGRAPRRDQARLDARVLDYTLRRKPTDGSKHWSSRKLAAQLGGPS
jgi:hypothetical protein